MCVKVVSCQDVDWITLALDKEQWRCLVSTVINIIVSYNERISLTN
jgi:hypothetical protein